MNAAQRKTSAAALMAEAGDDPARRLAAMAAAPQLVLRSGEHLLGVEYPLHAPDALPTTTVDPGTLHRRSLGQDEIEAAYVAGEVRLHSLAEGLTLIADPSGPEGELANRRAEIAERRRRAAEAKAARAETERQAAIERERWAIDNASRIAAWNKLPLEIQRLHTAADKMPAYRPLLMLLAELAAVPPQTGLSLPQSFRPELARK